MPTSLHLSANQDLTGFADVSVPISSLRDFVQYSSKKSTIGSKRLMLVCPEMTSASMEIAETFTSGGVSVCVSTDTLTAYAPVSANPSDWHAVVEILPNDACLEEVVGRLLEFRTLAPGVVVMLISPRFGKDDLTCERRAVADVSLRAPVSPDVLLAKLRVAERNNVDWQCRHADA